MIEKQELKQKLLVNAAIDMFYEKGFQNTRVSDIVAKAGVAQGTFYLYFKSKDEVFIHICKAFTTLFFTVLEEDRDLFSGASYAQAHEKAYRFIHKSITLFTANEKMAKILFSETGGHGDKFGSLYAGVYIEFVNVIRRRLEQNSSSDYIYFEDAETEAVFMFGLFDRAMFYFREVKKKVDIDALSRRMADFIIGGLSKKG